MQATDMIGSSPFSGWHTIYINIQVGLVDLPPVLSGSKIEVFDNNESVCLVARIGQF